MLHEIPKYDGYDGIGSPTKHLNVFKTHIGLRGAMSTVKCQDFHLTLNGAAEVWYTYSRPKAFEAGLI